MRLRTYYGWYCRVLCFPKPGTATNQAHPDRNHVQRKAYILSMRPTKWVFFSLLFYPRSCVLQLTFRVWSCMCFLMQSQQLYKPWILSTPALSILLFITCSLLGLVEYATRQLYSIDFAFAISESGDKTSNGINPASVTHYAREVSVSQLVTR